MTWDQLAKLWNDYGAFVALCVVGTVVLSTLIAVGVKFWPILTRTVDFIQTLIELPARLDSIDESAKTINTTINANGQILGRTVDKLDTHIAAAAQQVVMLERHDRVIQRFDQVLADIDEKVGVVKHEVKNNGGGSMKDAVDRSESRLSRLEQLLLERLSPDVPLTATGSITITADGGAPHGA